MTLTRAATKFAGSIARRAGAAGTYADWPARAAICERCPMRVVAGNVSYCGQPFYRKPVRDDAEDGCGCPTRDKAKSADEHCPLTVRNLPTALAGNPCECKWCAAKNGVV